MHLPLDPSFHSPSFIHQSLSIITRYTRRQNIRLGGEEEEKEKEEEDEEEEKEGEEEEEHETDNY